jgi:phage-related protein
MTVQTFPNIAPSAGSNEKRTFNVLKTSFGDGYQQRAAAGINSARTVWQLSWQGLTTTNANTVEAFIEARGGHESFYWTPPNSSQGRWVCEGFSRTEEGAAHASISATFV